MHKNILNMNIQEQFHSKSRFYFKKNDSVTSCTQGTMTTVQLSLMNLTTTDIYLINLKKDVISKLLQSKNCI